jgi:hypothetical protein
MVTRHDAPRTLYFSGLIGIIFSNFLGLKMLFFETSRLSRNYQIWYARALVQTVWKIEVVWPASDKLTFNSGRNKLLINHLGKLFITSDAATIIREIEVVHPAAKLLVMASQAQEAEVRSRSYSRYRKSRLTFMQMGDATNTVLIFAGELLKKAEHLLIMGLHPSEIIKGYDLARIKALAELESVSSDAGLCSMINHYPSTFHNEASFSVHPSLPCKSCQTGNRVKTIRL